MQGWVETQIGNFRFAFTSDAEGDDWDIEIDHTKYRITEKRSKTILKALGDKFINKHLERAMENAQDNKWSGYDE